MLVIPVTWFEEPRTYSWSLVPAPVKLALSVMVPPPAKLPVSRSASLTSVSLPKSSVPPAARDRLNVRLTVPSANLMLAPAPMEMFSHPVTVLAASEPDTSLPLNESVLPLLEPSAVSVPMLEMSTPSSVRLFESFASLIVPLSAAPFSTITLSQPFSPCTWTVECSSPEPPLNLSVSFPAPPCISPTPENVPPAKCSTSFPGPRSIFPCTAAPGLTVTVALPRRASRIAVVPLTTAPLSSAMATGRYSLALLDPVVLMAAWAASLEGVDTLPKTVTRVDPVPV